MFKHSTGYVFDARVDCNSAKGIKESFRLFNGIANITCGVNNRGGITRIRTYTADGFRSVRDLGVSIDAYIRSNRATYAVVGDCTYIANVKYNLRTGVCEIQVFIPVQDIRIINGSGKTYPGVCCYLISTENGLHRFRISDKIYNALIQSIKSQIMNMNLTSKASYFTSRL